MKNDGTVWACGANLYGQLGTGNNTNSSVAVQVTGLCSVLDVNEITEPILFSVYPNPSDGIYTLQLTTQQLNNSTIFIYNVLGEKILQQKIVSDITEINLTGKSGGIYFVRMTEGEKIFVRKLVKVNSN